MIRWLKRESVLAIHELQLTEHGGGTGIRDEGLLLSALARPMNYAAYGDPDLPELGALYALAIAQNHPFVDGNKRTAWSSLVTFFGLNDVEFEPPEVEAAMTMLGMAAGDISDADFIAWVRRHARAHT